MHLPQEIPIPPVIQTLQLITHPTQFLDQCASMAGDIFTTRVMGWNSPPIVFLSSPDAIAQVFAIPAGKLDFQTPTYVFQPLFGDNSLVLQPTSEHSRQRNLLLPSFHGEKIRAYGEIICRITQEAISTWSLGKEVKMQSLMPDITLQIILQVVFGISPGENYQKLRRLLTSLLHDITTPWYSSLFFFPSLQKDWGKFSPWGNYLYRKKQIDDLIYQEIHQRRQQLNSTANFQRKSETQDILSLLLSARDSTGKSLNDTELKDQLISLLLLGYETTSGVLCWLFYLVHSHPQVKTKLLQELNSLNPIPTPEEITQLPYLDAVCKETMRLHPIALICTPRIVKEPVQIDKYQFLPNTVLIPCIYLAHRRSHTYNSPTTYIPERFLERKFSSFEYLPFGGGYRGCIGSAFSMYELKLVFATIMLNYQLELLHRKTVYPQRRGITIVPSGGVPMRIKSKSSSVSLPTISQKV